MTTPPIPIPTPLPWFVLPNGHCIAGPFVPDEGDDPDQHTAGVALFGMRLRSNAEAAANAALTVHAVNAHAALLGVVREVLRIAHIPSPSAQAEALDRLEPTALAALALAEGKEVGP